MAIVTCGALLATAVPALAGQRLPGGVARINVTISFPLKTVNGYHRPVHTTLTRASTVAKVVSATDALPLAQVRGACPMIMRIGPELEVVFRNAAGRELAVASADVAQGSKGDSGSDACFPIRFTSAGKLSDLLGNGWVRMMGRLAGTSIS